jgi:hypothetical protein
VVYGDDFAQPMIADIADVTVPFETNRSIGTTEEPFLLFVPETQTGVESVQKSEIRSQKVLQNGQLIIERDGKRYDVMGGEVKIKN